MLYLIQSHFYLDNDNCLMLISPLSGRGVWHIGICGWLTWILPLRRRCWHRLVLCLTRQSYTLEKAWDPPGTIDSWHPANIDEGAFVSQPAQSVAVLIREVPRCFRFWIHLALFAAALAYGRIRKTKVMSAPFCPFFGCMDHPIICFCSLYYSITGVMI